MEINIIVIFNILLGLVSIIFLITAIIIGLVTKINYNKCKLKITGVVVDVRRVSVRWTNDSASMVSWAPVIKYYVDGKYYTKMSSVRYANKNKFKVGDNIEIYVNENNPTNICIDNNTMRILRIVFTVVSVVCFSTLIVLNIIARIVV